MRRSIVFILILLVCTTRGFGQNTTVFRQDAYKNAEIGIYVLDMATGKTVVDFKTAPIETPASVLKLLTTATALELLGPDYQFITTLYYTGTIKAGILNGDLVVVGGGDPTLGSRHFAENKEAFLQEWVKAVKNAGIVRIDGRVLVDATLFDTEGVSPYWLWEDIGNYYATGVYGLNVFDNSFQLLLKSGSVGGIPEIIKTIPTIPSLSIENNLRSAANNTDSAYLYGAPFQNEMRLFGTIPANKESFSIRGQLPNPSVLLVSMFSSRLKDAGISIYSKMLPANSPRTKLTSVSSPALHDIVQLIHAKSDNFYAECLLRQLAVKEGFTPASAKDGIRVIKKFWMKQGLDLSALSMYDASGLSPNNRVSAELIARLLLLESKQKQGALFESTLPLAGKEGTVSGFLKGTALEGLLRLKSGSNEVVNSYAGYYRVSNKKFAVAMLINHAQKPRQNIRKDMEVFLLSL